MWFIVLGFLWGAVWRKLEFMNTVKDKLVVAAELDPRSPYETLFKTRHRRPGRPDAAEPIFPSGAYPPPVVDAARRRAFAVLHEEGKARLAELFVAEAAVLNERFVADMKELEEGDGRGQ